MARQAATGAAPTRVGDDRTLPELTLRGLVLGALITVVFTGANVYLGLKVGLTFSSSIPAAVISMAVLRLLPAANILENNMVQTQASAAGTLSAIIFVVPGLVMVGRWHGFPFWQTAGICAAGGILGVIYTIPLRRAMVVQSSLPYPEGVAAAEVLRVGSGEGTAAGAGRAEPGLRDILLGGGVAAAFTFLASGLKVLADGVSWWFAVGNAVFRVASGFSLALLGAGYLVGIVGGLAMLTGVVIAWGVAVPLLTALDPAPAGTAISAHATGIWSGQVRFVGAGAIGIAAVWTLLNLLGPMAEGVRASFAAVRDVRGSTARAPRTERDMPILWLAGIGLALLATMTVLFAAFLGQPEAPPPPDGMTWTLVACGVAFVFLFGFLIAAACGYMAGLVGSSASPISGIGILAVVLVSLLLLLILGEAGAPPAPGEPGAGGGGLAIGLVLFTTSLIVATAAIANDNLQDLKTGWLVGATPWRQQAALMVGCLAGAAVIPPILDLLYQAYGFPGALPRPGMDPGQALAAPQATLMAAIATGIFTHRLDWTMILIGMALGVALIGIDAALARRGGSARLPPLAVGIGIYLPPTVSVTIVIGAAVGWLLDRFLRRRAAIAAPGGAAAAEAALERPRRRAVLLASGLIVGESLVGVLLAAVIAASGGQEPLALVGEDFAATASWLGLAAFVAVCAGFCAVVLAGERRTRGIPV